MTDFEETGDVEVRKVRWSWTEQICFVGLFRSSIRWSVSIFMFYAESRASLAERLDSSLRENFVLGEEREEKLTILTCMACRSASEKTATVLIPSFLQVLMIRTAISPLLRGK
jgi:hypothetical protein